MQSLDINNSNSYNNDMNPERKNFLRELTPEENEISELLIEQYNLQEYANQEITVAGITRTLKDGLGLCSEEILEKTEDETNIIIQAMLSGGSHSDRPNQSK